jgi:hypothetical protein
MTLSEEVYAKHAPQIIAFCRKWIDEESAVMIILQYVFERFEQQNKQVKFTDKSLGIYLRICARSCIKNYLVNRQVRKN